MLGPDVDASLRQIGGYDQGPGGIRANDEVSQAFIRAARDGLAARAGARCVVMTTADTRRTARRLLKQSGIDAPVLSYADVAAEFQVRTVGVLSGETRAAA